MALRGGFVAFARQRNHSSLLSFPTYLNLSFRDSPSPSFHRFPPNPPPPIAGIKCPIRAVHEATVGPITADKQNDRQSPPDWKIKMLYDGDCPLCMREVNMLRERNKNYGTIKFVDISSPDYSAEENQGLDYETVMGRIHAILSDGTVVTDVDAFKKLYEQVGLGWVYAITNFEPIGRLANAVYGVWAKYRLQITGRPPIEEILESRKNKGEVCKDSSACKM